MAKKTVNWDFFLSYAKPDKTTAENLSNLLSPFAVFLDDRSLPLGKDWDKELPEAQRSSLITVALISSHSEEAYYQREEIAAAIQLSRDGENTHRVVPVLMDEELAHKRSLYGLRLKQGISIIAAGGLENVATHLKDLVATLKKKGNVQRDQNEAVNRTAFKNELKLQKAIGELSEEDLIADVIVPLVEALHSGKIELTYSPNENNRAIVSSGYDNLDRTHILCVLVETPPISYEVQEFELRMGTAVTALKSGLTRENGTSISPNEVWLLTPRLFPEQYRKPLSNLLKDLEHRGIKFVPGEEVSTLLLKRLPDVAARLSKFSSPETVNVIATLSKHSEGRAFGFSKDRNISEFYVTASLSPHAVMAYEAINNERAVGDFDAKLELPVRLLLNAHDLNKSDQEIEKLLKEKAIQQVGKGILKKYKVVGEITLSDSPEAIKKKYVDSYLFSPGDFINGVGLIDKLITASDPVSQYVRKHLSTAFRRVLNNVLDHPEFGVSYNILNELAIELNKLLTGASLYDKRRFKEIRLSAETYDYTKTPPEGDEVIIFNRMLLRDAYKEISTSQNAKRQTITIELRFKLEAAFHKLVKETTDAVRKCPHILTDYNFPLIRQAWLKLESTDFFIKTVSEDLKKAVYITHPDDLDTYDIIRIRVPQPEHLLKLEKLILIEGSPGCGKTTLLKTLAINLISNGEKVYHLSCSNIPPNSRRDSLEQIVEKYSLRSVSQSGDSSDCVLIIDALDEAPFDMSTHVLAGRKKFANIVTSARDAFDTKVRSEAFRVSLSPFDDQERNLFFERWFGNDAELIEQAKELIRQHEDINTHTRLPLIATILVALLQNGKVPTTRAEVYGFRLDLLLSRWDRFRGIKRMYVNNPDAKRRLLKAVAYEIHAAKGRRRNIKLNDLRDVYEMTLGEWGNTVGYDKVLHDLVVGSGVLIEERRGVFSFGHLTFQEHLAGEYLADNYRPERISSLLGNDWWREPLNFYASTVGDITDLISYEMNGANYIFHARQLSEMAAYAPFTSTGAIQSLNELV